MLPFSQWGGMGVSTKEAILVGMPPFLRILLTEPTLLELSFPCACRSTCRNGLKRLGVLFLEKESFRIREEV